MQSPLPLLLHKIVSVVIHSVCCVHFESNCQCESTIRHHTHIRIVEKFRIFVFALTAMMARGMCVFDSHAHIVNPFSDPKLQAPNAKRIHVCASLSFAYTIPNAICVVWCVCVMSGIETYAHGQVNWYIKCIEYAIN